MKDGKPIRMEVWSGVELRVQCFFDGHSEIEKKLGEVIVAINCVEKAYNTDCGLFEIVYDDRDS